MHAEPCKHVFDGTGSFLGAKQASALEFHLHNSQAVVKLSICKTQLAENPGICRASSKLQWPTRGNLNITFRSISAVPDLWRIRARIQT